MSLSSPGKSSAYRAITAVVLGLAISKADGYIAATAIANGMMVATRDVSPFKAADVDVINPWES
ncbi:type II toxin-antitoxin system VapC family toxin [Xenorhabdus bovienii]|uniref:type II toxin-antitoxin system VapC family toxin n=1 Tax=Xenorhabdus bovienii TaxID=40576 RepID=UPI0023B2A99E|nr:type II toxin-antitoxin system VapC family toxin [Xenorhabdus bovienii]MDE9540702.1 type II toxin-antitoxin system VapC family toxin [Xenorhabdus bovienii]